MSGPSRSYDDLFQRAVALVLRHEGGFSNDPDDPGGATDFGISLRFLKGVGDMDGDGFLDGDFDHDGDVDIDDIRLLDRGTAEDIYRTQWWNRYPYGLMADAGGDLLAIKTFDLAINMGPRRAHRLLQEGIRDCGHAVDTDGIIGPKTLEAIHACDRTELLRNYQYQAISYYRSLKKPKYLNGWINRVSDFQGV